MPKKEERKHGIYLLQKKVRELMEYQNTKYLKNIRN